MIAVNVATLQHQVLIFYQELQVFPDLLTCLDDDDGEEGWPEQAAQRYLERRVESPVESCWMRAVCKLWGKFHKILILVGKK